MSETTEGWIKRIHLVNFMVYSDFCFLPSPGLNILLAPNGSGKSSIVSAIILGLGGKPELIGRASKIGEYVKFGEEKSSICIHLNNPIGEDYIVQRKFKLNGSSKWYINSELAKHEDVCDLMKNLKIYVDNLCQILPQDKVEDFAKLNNKQLLESTLMTLGNQNLFEKFIKLKEHREKLAYIKNKINSLNIMMKEENDGLSNSEEAVKSFQKRNQLLKKIELCEKKLAWINYQNCLKEYGESKKVVEEQCKLYKEKAAALTKKVDHCRQLEMIASKRKNEMEEKQAQLKKMLKKSDDRSSKMEKQAVEIVALRGSIDKNKSEENDRMRRFVLCTEESDELNSYLGELNVNEIKAKIDMVDEKFKSVSQEGFDLRNRETSLKNELGEAEVKYRMSSAKHDRLEGGKAKLDSLVDKFDDMRSVVNWIEGNRNKMFAPVHGPLFKEISVIDRAYTKYIEAAISTQDLISFITETIEDANILYKNTRTAHGWMINIAHCDPPKGPIPVLFYPTIPLQEIRALGFEHYLIDLVEASPVVKRFLCYFKNLHNIPVTRKAIDMDTVPDSIRMFFTGDKMISTKISIYSGNRVSTCSFLKEAKYLETAVEPSVIQASVKSVQAAKDEIKNVNNKMTELAALLDEWKRKCNEVRLEKKPYTDKLAKFRELQAKAQRFQEEMMSLNSKSMKYAAEDSARYQRYLALFESLKEVNKHSFQGFQRFEVLQANIDVTKMYYLMLNHCFKESKVNCKVDKAEAMKEQDDFDKMREKHLNLNVKVEEMHKRAKLSTSGYEFNSPEFKKHFGKSFKTLPDTEDELSAELYNCHCVSQCLHNPQEQKIMEAFNVSKKKLSELESMITFRSRKYERLDGLITSIRGPWLQQVNQFIENINTNFSTFFTSMGCNGYVNLEKGTDPEAVENFGLQVQVQFRDAQGYQVLDGQKMSGGERAITTAVYLLSLQHYTSAPFRCVDEINQGMDAENEGRLYKLLFNSVCTENLQYFLLSPKLLKDAEFTERCCLHIITNNKMVKDISSVKHSLKDVSVKKRTAGGSSRKRKLT